MPTSAAGCAWITGASSGLGRALARRMASEGWRVAVSARRDSELHDLADEATALPGAIFAYPLDVTDESAVAATVAAIERELGPIGLAVLNAGSHKPVRARHLAPADFRALLDLNVMGTVNCLAPLIERMAGRAAGRIAIVASIAGYGGLPTASAYGASKAALINMAEALKPELDELGVTVQIVNPGFVATPLTDRNRFPMPFLMDVDEAAAALRRGLDQDSFEITFPRRFSWLMKAVNLLPYRLYFAVTRRMVPADDA